MNEQVPSPLPPPLLSKPSSRTLGEIANRFRGRKESRKRENKRCIHVEKNSRPRRRIISSVKNYYSVVWWEGGGRETRRAGADIVACRREIR